MMMGGMGGGGFGPGAMMRGGQGGQVWAREKASLKTPLGQLLGRIGGVLGEFKKSLFWALATLVFAAMLQMAPPYATRYVVDHVLPQKNASVLPAVLVCLILIFGFRYWLMYTSRVTVSNISQQFVYAMAKGLFEHVERLSLKFYEREGTGEIISRATSDINVLQQAMQGGMVQAGAGLFNMVAYAVVLLVLDWKLAMLVYASVPLLIGASYLSSEMLRIRYIAVQERISAVNGVLAENIVGVRVAKAFAREDASSARFVDRNRENLDANMATAMVQAISGPAIQFIGVASTGLILWVGASRVMSGSLSVGTLVAFVSYLLQFYAPIDDLIRINATVQQALAAAERVFEFMDEKAEVIEKVAAVDLGADGPVRGHVRIEDVWFSYIPGQPVLKGVSIDAPPGTMVALVGHTGSGKTSMINLIPRFYDIDSGHLTIDGRDVRDLTLDSLRAHIGVVLQETFLFSTTIRENIRYGRLDATDEEVEAAAKEAHAHEFILSLPKGYETNAGESGALLSRGQRQRLSLARAILRDPKILILDEATSDVDTETELLIQQALERVMEGRTVFVIAHRLSTIRSADLICVLDHGTLVESGSHEELLKKGGRYRELYEIQFAGEGSGEAVAAG